MREKAVKEIMELQRLSAQHVRKSTVASERLVDTSGGAVRVLEYGFDSLEKRPLFVDIHGGGYCLLSPEFDEPTNLRIVKETGAKVIAIDYPKAPQHPYPEGIDAVYEVIKHYSDNADTYGIDADNIGIGGMSSGGNFAAVTCIRANENKDFKLRYQVLTCPSTNPAKEAHEKPKGDEKYLPNERIKSFVLCYLTDPEQAKLPYVSPVRATDGQLTGLPSALIIVAGDSDPLRPDGLHYAERLISVGVPVEVRDEFTGSHGFMSEDTLEAKAAQDAIVEFIRKNVEPSK